MTFVKLTRHMPKPTITTWPEGNPLHGWTEAGIVIDRRGELGPLHFAALRRSPVEAVWSVAEQWAAYWARHGKRRERDEGDKWGNTGLSKAGRDNPELAW